MTAEQVYLDIINNLKIVNPKMGQVLEYLRPYYVFHQVPRQKQKAIEILNNRYPSKTSYEKYYDIYFNQAPKYDDYSDKRDYFIALGKHHLNNILKENENFKDEYDKFILKLENIPKGNNYQTNRKIFEQIMMQLVYRCADINAFYCGSLTYTTAIYKYLANKAVSEIRDYIKQNKEENSVSKKN